MRKGNSTLESQGDLQGYPGGAGTRGACRGQGPGGLDTPVGRVMVALCGDPGEDYLAGISFLNILLGACSLQELY